MTDPTEYDYGPDYDKWAQEVMDRCIDRNIDISDPDNVEPVAREMAEELVLNPDELAERARERANAFEKAGRIDMG